MKFLLDSNAVIELLKGNPAVSERARRFEPADFGLPAVVAHELYFGAFKSNRTAVHLARLDALRFDVVAFDREDARRAGEVRALLASRGTPVGGYDTLIAGQTLARRLTLITHNLRDFARVPGLTFEDWQDA